MKRLSGGQRGLTLIEVLVALAVASVGLLALYGAVGGGLAGIRKGYHADMAMLEARSRLAWAEALGPAADGRAGTLPGGGRWRVRVRPAATTVAAGDYRLFDIEVEVRHNGQVLVLPGQTMATWRP